MSKKIKKVHLISGGGVICGNSFRPGGQARTTTARTEVTCATCILLAKIVPLDSPVAL